MARLRDLLGYKTYAIRSDGAKFVNGVRNDGANTSWLSYSNGILTLGPGVYDELLFQRRFASDEEIVAWHKAGVFHDAETQIQGTYIADGAITTDKLAAGSVTADKLAANSVSADKIYGGTLRLTGDMAIESQDGRAIVGPLVSGGFGFSAENAAGDRSELTEGRLAFYKAGSQAPFFYVRHIEYGTAEAGEQVTFDVPFESPPRVLVAVQRLTTYDPSVGGVQVWSVFPENVTETGFIPRARLEVVGAKGAETTEYSSGTRPGNPAFQIFSGDPGYPTPMAPVGVESMSFRFRFTVSGGHLGSYGQVLLFVYKDGEDWNSNLPIASHSLISGGTQTFTASISNLDTNARYRWALAAFGVPAPPPTGGPVPSVKVDMLRWDWVTSSLIVDQSGRVQWIAVENE